MDRTFKRVCLVVQLSKAFTREPIESGVTVTGSNGAMPIQKTGGFYVFTGGVPESIIVSSSIYRDIQTAVFGERLRLELVSREEQWPRGTTGCRLTAAPGETVHLFAGGKQYKLTSDISEGDTGIRLYKPDFDDICLLYHAPLRRGGSFGAPFMLVSATADGSFITDKAFEESLARPGGAIAALCTLIADGSGEIVFPVPDTDVIYVFRKSAVTRLDIIRGQMNEFNLEV